MKKKGMKQVLVLCLAAALLTSAMILPGIPGAMAASDVNIGQTIADSKWKNAGGTGLTAANGVIKVTDYAYLDEVLNAGKVLDPYSGPFAETYTDDGDVVTLDIGLALKSGQSHNDSWNNFPCTFVLMDQKNDGVRTGVTGISLDYQYSSYAGTAGRRFEGRTKLNGAEIGSTSGTSAGLSVKMLDGGWHRLTFKVAAMDNTKQKLAYQVFLDGVRIINEVTWGSVLDSDNYKTGKFAIFASEWYDVYVKDPANNPNKLDVTGQWLDKIGSALTTVDSTTGVVKVNGFAYLDEIGTLASYPASGTFADDYASEKDFVGGNNAEFEVKIEPKDGADTSGARWSVGFTLQDPNPKAHPVIQYFDDPWWRNYPSGTNDPALSFIFNNDNKFHVTTTKDKARFATSELATDELTLADGNWHTVKLQAGFAANNVNNMSAMLTVDGAFYSQQFWTSGADYAALFGSGYLSVFANGSYDVYIRAAGSSGEYTLTDDGGGDDSTAKVNVAQTISAGKWLDAKSAPVKVSNGVLKVERFSWLNQTMMPGNYSDSEGIPNAFEDGSVLEFDIKAAPKQGASDNGGWVFSLNQLDLDPLSHTAADASGTPIGVNSKGAITSFYGTRPWQKPRGLYTMPTLGGDVYNKTGVYTPTEYASQLVMADGRWHTVRLTAAIATNDPNICAVIISVDGTVVSKGKFWLRSTDDDYVGSYKDLFENGGKFSINANTNFNVYIRDTANTSGEFKEENVQAPAINYNNFSVKNAFSNSLFKASGKTIPVSIDGTINMNSAYDAFIDKDFTMPVQMSFYMKCTKPIGFEGGEWDLAITIFDQNTKEHWWGEEAKGITMILKRNDTGGFGIDILRYGYNKEIVENVRGAGSTDINLFNGEWHKMYIACSAEGETARFIFKIDDTQVADQETTIPGFDLERYFASGKLSFTNPFGYRIVLQADQNEAQGNANTGDAFTMWPALLTVTSLAVMASCVTFRKRRRIIKLRKISL